MFQFSALLVYDKLYSNFNLLGYLNTMSYIQINKLLFKMNHLSLSVQVQDSLQKQLLSQLLVYDNI